VSERETAAAVEAPNVVAVTGDVSPVIPAAVRELLGPAPLLSSENPDAYERVLAQMALAIAPADFVEWWWVKDLVDALWDAARAQRAKITRLEQARKAAIGKFLKEGWPEPELDSYRAQCARHAAVARGALQGVPSDLLVLERALARLGLPPGAAEDVAYAESLRDLQRLQTLADAACARRNAILREIDRRRDAASARIRRAAAAMEAVLDAEFSDAAG
jgi:hypothetical protein